MELEAVEIARRHLEAMWDEPGSAFKHFDSTAALPSSSSPNNPKPSAPNKPPAKQQSETQPEEWADDEGIRDVLSMGPSTTTAGKAKVAKKGLISSSSGGGASSSGVGASSSGGGASSVAVQDAAARMERDLAESSALYKANREDMLAQLREGPVPFGTFVCPRLAMNPSKRKVDQLTQDCLRAVSPDALPTALGRKDQFTKRLHLPDPRPVSAEKLDELEGVLDDVLIAKMRRAQAYAVRDDRPHIMWACVDAFRNASSR